MEEVLKEMKHLIASNMDIINVDELIEYINKELNRKFNKKKTTRD